MVELGRKTDDGGGVIRPDTAEGRTFYCSITAERERERLA